MPTAAAWGVERGLAGTRRFITYRQGLVGGNLLAAYFLAVPVLPGALLLVQPAWARPRAHILAGAGVAVTAATGLAWLGIYHLFALMVAVPGWGVLAVALALLFELAVGVGWCIVGVRGEGRRARAAHRAPPR